MAVIRQGYATLSAFPPTGLANIIYVDFSTGIEYVYTTSYILFTPTKASLLEGYKDSTWFTANPNFLLGKGQRINLLQTGTYKLGDGVTQLSVLSFLGGGGSQTLAQTLVLGNTTGTNDIVLSGTKELKTDNNTNKIALNGAIVGDIDIYSEGDLVLNTDGNIEIQTFDVNVYANVRLQNETALEILATDINQRIKPLPVATYPNLTEISYVKDVTSPIQTQLNSKEPVITPTTNVDFWSGAKTFINFASTTLSTALTGFSASAGTVASTDTILQAFNKIVGNIALKLTANVAIIGATKTKITYDSNGLVTSGTDATTADINDSTNRRYITDAQLVVVGNTSNTNTGDNAVNTLYSGLVTNATHTGEVTGATALTVDKTAITNKTLVTADASDHVLIADASDSGNLKKVLVSDFGGASALIVANRQTASYTLVLTDATKLVEMNVGSANNCTIPLNATVAFPIGTQILVDQTGAGQTTLVATGGVTLNYTDTLKTRVQNSTLCLIKIGTDEWDISGDTEPLVPAIVQADLDALLITANRNALLYATSF